MNLLYQNREHITGGAADTLIFSCVAAMSLNAEKADRG